MRKTCTKDHTHTHPADWSHFFKLPTHSSMHMFLCRCVCVWGPLSWWLNLCDLFSLSLPSWNLHCHQSLTIYVTKSFTYFKYQFKICSSSGFDPHVHTKNYSVLQIDSLAFFSLLACSGCVQMQGIAVFTYSNLSTSTFALVYFGSHTCKLLSPWM